MKENKTTKVDNAIAKPVVATRMPKIDVDADYRSIGWVYLVALIALLAFGGYAQWLNSIVYEKDAPFHDSMSYYDRLYEVISVRQQQGLIPAIENACFKPSTLCLPYLMAIPFSFFFDPCRAIGVWIEVIYFGVFLFSLIYFLDRYRGMSCWGIIVAIVQVFLVSALYRERAGIADFRVDLPLAFLYGATSCWLLIACHRRFWSDFAVVGILMGLACLSRGIAPVFLTAGFLPLVVYQLFRVEKKKRFASQLAVALAITVLIAGWFYYFQVNNMYFYYFLWNTDANANISFTKSFGHVVAAAKSIGPFLAVYLLSLFVISRSVPASGNLPKERARKSDADTSTNDDLTSIASVENSLDEVDGRNIECRNTDRRNIERPVAFYWFLWIGLAPLIVLILKRAYVNPFVSLPAVIGLLLFWLTVQQNRIEQLVQLRFGRVAYTSGICLVLACSYGYIKHYTGFCPGTASAQNQILEVIRADAEQDGNEEVSFANVVLTHICDSSMKSTLQFDRDGRFVSTNQVEVDGIVYQSSQMFALSAAVDWQEIPGDTIDEKVGLLIERTESTIDYVICPTLGSIPSIQAHFKSTLTSKYAPLTIDAMLASGFLVPISKPINATGGIYLVVYKNVSRNRLSDRNSK